MPNGKIHDHPLSDILIHDAASYPDDINQFVRGMAQLPGFKSIQDRVAAVLWDDWPQWGNVTPDFQKVRAALHDLRKEIDPTVKKPAE
jgi:hypothetical protein